MNCRDIPRIFFASASVSNANNSLTIILVPTYYNRSIDFLSSSRCTLNAPRIIRSDSWSFGFNKPVTVFQRYRRCLSLTVEATVACVVAVSVMITSWQTARTLGMSYCRRSFRTCVYNSRWRACCSPTLASVKVCKHRQLCDWQVMHLVFCDSLLFWLWRFYSTWLLLKLVGR